MQNRYIGKRRIQKIFTDEGIEPPAISAEAITELNELLLNAIEQIMLYANEYRIATNPKRRLSTRDIELGYKKYIKEEVKQNGRKTT